jgi:hypothetical protein
MCEVCDKVDFLIESMESLFSEKEWTVLLVNALKGGSMEGLDADLTAEEIFGSPVNHDEMIKSMVREPRNVWVNVISKIAARMCLKHQIHPQAIMPILAANMIEVFEGNHDAANRQLKERLKSYES